MRPRVAPTQEMPGQKGPAGFTSIGQMITCSTRTGTLLSQEKAPLFPLLPTPISGPKSHSEARPSRMRVSARCGGGGGAGQGAGACGGACARAAEPSGCRVTAAMEAVRARGGRGRRAAARAGSRDGSEREAITSRSLATGGRQWGGEEGDAAAAAVVAAAILRQRPWGRACGWARGARGEGGKGPRGQDGGGRGRAGRGLSPRPLSAPR